MDSTNRKTFSNMSTNDSSYNDSAMVIDDLMQDNQHESLRSAPNSLSLSQNPHTMQFKVEPGQEMHPIMTGMEWGSQEQQFPTFERMMTESSIESTTSSLNSISFGQLNMNDVPQGSEINHDIHQYTSQVIQPLPRSLSSHIYGGDVHSFLQSMQLVINQDAQALLAAIGKLESYGYDTVIALYFADPNDFQEVGIYESVDHNMIHEGSEMFREQSQFSGPPIHSDALVNVGLEEWLIYCGIPSQLVTSPEGYGERLRRLGCRSPQDLIASSALPDFYKTLASFRIGHLRLVRHYLDLARFGQSHPPIHLNDPQNLFYETWPRSRESVTHALHLSQANGQKFAQSMFPYGVHSNINDLPHQSSQDGIYNLQTPQISPLIQLQSTESPVFVTSPNKDQSVGGNSPEVINNGIAMKYVTSSGRIITPEILKLLHEAVNMPQPNPCRGKGQKVQWKVLAQGEMNSDRFAPLARFTETELKSVYAKHFTITGSRPKPELWTRSDLDLLRQAKDDDRVKHLGKVCWESLAGGRTGVEEYQPLNKFTASQLRSRYRSVYGDKKPKSRDEKAQQLSTGELANNDLEQEYMNYDEMEDIESGSGDELNTNDYNNTSE